MKNANNTNTDIERRATLPTFSEALRAIEEARAEVPPLPNFDAVESLYNKLVNAPTENERAAVREAIRQKNERAAEIKAKRLRAEIKISLLKHNARIALYMDILPFIVDILKKYNGKPHGEKTREKIREEIRLKTNCFVWLQSDEITALPYHNGGFTSRDYEIKIYTVYNPATQSRPTIITNENKINALPLEAFTLYGSKGGAFNIPEAVADVFRTFDEARAAWDAWKSAARAFNQYAVGSIKELNERDGFRGYIL